MSPEKIGERLLSLREMDFVGAEKLAQEITKEARQPLWSLMRVLEWAEHPDRKKAEVVLKTLAELAILPWLVGSRRLEGGPRIEALSEAYRLYRELDGRVIEKLRGMLKGKTPLPPPDVPGAVEVRVPVTCECDEAYMLLRHLQRPDEAEVDDRRQRLVFARMSEEERDHLIREYLSTGEFR